MTAAGIDRAGAQRKVAVMKKVKMPHQKYRPYPVVRMPDRRWPDKVITKAPAWCSVDLRDGNQALSTPMSIEQKMDMFHMLVEIGFKEIEVGFPSASTIEFDFVRQLIEKKHIPDDVTIQVITQAREDLIRRTFASIKGAEKAIVHLYNSTSTVQRRVVFGKTKRGIIRIAADAAKVMAELKKEYANPGIRFQYSPESFPGTELDFALDICHAVIDVWQPDRNNKTIINLPETVEMGTPNIFADRIEWFIRRVRNKEAVIVSVHTHNDRATGVAAAEFAVMAGAERVEGALFGNGERTGNMDIMTMAMNMYAQGVDPKLDFSRMRRVREVYTRCTGMEVHPRHPYAGDLVFTAFSGSHQDAINKGMKAMDSSKHNVWEVPYLPIDPRDVGCSYETIIRINSQSGKGGIAYIMEQDWGVQIPKDMQRDFARVVQAKTEERRGELSSKDIFDCFEAAYLKENGPMRLESCEIHAVDGMHGKTRVKAVIRQGRKTIEVGASGNGPVDAFVKALRDGMGVACNVVMYAEHARTTGADAQAIAYIGVKFADGRTAFGAGEDASINNASIKAIISAVNRRVGQI